MQRIFWCLLGLTLICGCSQKSETKDTEAAGEPAPLPSPRWEISRTEDEDALLLRLASNMTGAPKNEVERGKNAAAEFVLEQGWDMQATRTGLLYQVVESGEGELIQWGDRLAAHYEGRFLDGEVFDSSFERGKPLEFYVGNMVPGWNEGLQKARVGSKLLLVIPSHLGYGSQGLSDGKGEVLVPPHANLVFRIAITERLKQSTTDHESR